MTIGRQFGLDPAVLADVVNVSTGRSFVSENLLKQHVLSGAFGTGFALGLLAKDVKIAADLADQIGVDAPVGQPRFRHVGGCARRAWRRSGPHPRGNALGKTGPCRPPPNKRRWATNGHGVTGASLASDASLAA